MTAPLLSSMLTKPVTYLRRTLDARRDSTTHHANLPRSDVDTGGSVLGLDGVVDLAGLESFPASDPPGWTPTRVGPPSPSARASEPLLFHDVVQRLRDDVHLLSELGERHDGWPSARANLVEAADVVAERLAGLGLQVKRRPAAAEAEGPSNVEAVLVGSKRAGESIVVGAHYDTARGSPGADDNASGVAALLALAHELRERAMDRTVRLVAFTNEELLHTRRRSMGSVRYADALTREGPRVVAMISLEMLGLFRPPSRWPLPRILRPDTLAFVGDLRAWSLVRQAKSAFDSAETGIPIASVNLPLALPGVRSSDHWSFAKRKIPSMMITDTGPLRARSYHRPNDTAEQLDYERLARSCAGIAAVVRELARV